MYPVYLVTERPAQWLSLTLLALQTSLSPAEPIVTVHHSFPFSKKNIEISRNKIHPSTFPSILFNILFNFDISRLISNNGFSISTPGSYDSGGFHERDHCKSSSL